MNEAKETLDNARKRYLLSEASRDLNEALAREDYKTARIYAESMYDVIFELCGNQEGEEREAEKSRLIELSDLIDNINERLTSRGQTQ